MMYLCSPYIYIYIHIYYFVGETESYFSKIPTFPRRTLTPSVLAMRCLRVGRVAPAPGFGWDDGMTARQLGIEGAKVLQLMRI